MTNFVVGAVLARAALSFWLSAVIFAGDQFGWLLRACCVVRAVVELGRARPQTVSLSSRVRVGGGRRCRWWSPVLPSNLVIPAGCYVPRPVAARRAWCAAGRRVVGGGGMPFPPGFSSCRGHRAELLAITVMVAVRKDAATSSPEHRGCEFEIITCSSTQGGSNGERW